MTMIHKQQQHAGERRPWECYKNNSNIVSHLSEQQEHGSVVLGFSFISCVDILLLSASYSLCDKPFFFFFFFFFSFLVCVCGRAGGRVGGKPEM